MTMTMTHPSTTQDYLLSTLDEQLRSLLAARRLWSFLFHGTLYGALGCNALATLLLGLNKEAFSTHAQIASAVAGLLTIVATTGLFHKIWATTRWTRHAVWCLRVQMMAGKKDPATAADELATILGERERTLTAAPPQDRDDHT